MTALLEVRGLRSHYRRIQALAGVDLAVGEGELVTLVGANGAGKTTLLRAISGVQPASGGTIHLAERDITRASSAARVRAGIAQVPEGRQMFAPMSVEDNLLLGAYSRPRAERAEGLELSYRSFPVLAERRRQAAGTLSGGEQQMLAIGRALMARPRLLLLDEPSMGLAPRIVEQIFQIVQRQHAQGTTVFLVEQNAHAALAIADRGYVIESGRIVLEGTGRSLLADPQVQAAYLGM
jgi:branched-chain amino acid transport system ATP-binding protein